MQWSPLWAAVPSDGPPYQILHLSFKSFFCPWLGWEHLWVVLKRRYISLQNEWMNGYIYIAPLEIVLFLCRCKCGHARNEHPDSASDPRRPSHAGDKWSPEVNTVAFPTDAYGTIEFQGGSHPSKAQVVVVLSSDCPSSVNDCRQCSH